MVIHRKSSVRVEGEQSSTIASGEKSHSRTTHKRNKTITPQECDAMDKAAHPKHTKHVETGLKSGAESPGVRLQKRPVGYDHRRSRPIVRQMVNPEPLAKDRGEVKSQEFKGRLKGRDGFSPKDPRQGHVQDCFVPAGLGSIAAVNPDAIARSLIEIDPNSIVPAKFPPETMNAMVAVAKQLNLDLSGMTEQRRRQTLATLAHVVAHLKVHPYRLDQDSLTILRTVARELQEVDPNKRWFVVVFRRYDASAKRYVVDPEPVDTKLYVDKHGMPVYCASTGSVAPESMVLWAPLIEKAYVSWLQRQGGTNVPGSPSPRATGARASYELLHQGGCPADIMEAILGKPGEWPEISPDDADTTWNEITSRMQRGLPVSVLTRAAPAGTPYIAAGIFGGHAYSVLGFHIGPKGERVLELRNPHAKGEPPGNGPDDGVFSIRIERVCELFDYFCSVRDDASAPAA